MSQGHDYFDLSIYFFPTWHLSLKMVSTCLEKCFWMLQKLWTLINHLLSVFYLHASLPPGYVFCMLHRLPEQHECLFDHLGHGRQEAVLKMVKLDRKVGRSCQRIGEECSWAGVPPGKPLCPDGFSALTGIWFSSFNFILQGFFHVFFWGMQTCILLF